MALLMEIAGLVIADVFIAVLENVLVRNDKIFLSMGCGWHMYFHQKGRGG